MKIICIGRNYVNHAKELNNPIPENPVFFTKPETALVHNNEPFFYPDFSNNIHYEVEIVVRIHKMGKHIQEKFAHTYYNEIGIGIDFTARDLQEKCKQKGLPWEVAKAFDQSAPISKFINKKNFSDINNIDFSLQKNGTIVQEGNTKDMLFSIDQLIAYISQFITLKTGDLLFTGTPAGVGAIKIGDQLEAYIGEEQMLKVEIK